MEKVKESQKQSDLYSRLAHEAGHLAFQIDLLEGAHGEIMVKMHNANLAYRKAIEAETAKQQEEATKSEGVTA